jgi:hypothetical protein
MDMRILGHCLALIASLPSEMDGAEREVEKKIGGAAAALLAPAEGGRIPTPQGGALAAGDVNGDGFADLLLAEQKRLNVFQGSARCEWGKGADIQTEMAAGASELTLGDVNADGKLDAVLADHNSYDVTVLLGSGDGRFAPAEGSPFTAREGNQPHTHGLVAADVNGDGRLDIVTANNSDADLSLLLGDGAGRFARAKAGPFPCGEKPYPIAANDLNQDGFADMLVPNATPDDDEVKTLTVLLGSRRGDLTAARGSPLACRATVWYAAAGDLSGDGWPDAVATHSEGHTGAAVFLNDGRGGFAPAPGSPLELDHGAWGVEIADMNRDKRADLVIAADESIRVLLGDGEGRFLPAAGSPFPTGKGAWRLVVADFNGDGRLDVATRCVEAARIELLLGE